MKWLEPSYIAGKDKKWFRCCEKQAVPQKVKHIRTIWYISSTSKNISKRNEKKKELNKYLHMNVHSSTIDNSWKVEITQMSINKWMDKQIVVYTYNGILFSHKK